MLLKNDPELGRCSLHHLRNDPVDPATGENVLLRFDHAGCSSKLAEQQLNRVVEMSCPKD